MVRFRTLDVPEESRLEQLRHFLSANVMPFEMRFDHGPGFPCEVSTGRVGELHVTRNVTGPGEVTRTPKSVRQADPGMYHLCVVTDGQAVAEMDDRQVRLRPGNLAFWPSSRPFRWAHAAHSNVVVALPRELVPLDRATIARLRGPFVPHGQEISALVAGLARQLPGHFDERAPVHAARLGTAFLDLLTVMLAERLDDLPRVRPETRQAALARRIVAHIEVNLAEADLSPAGIAASHHVSVRYLYKLFEAEVGQSVASWIRQRRLDRCRRDLLDPQLRERPASAIGARWGFADASNFSRVFRAAYGVPPAEYRVTY